MKLIVAVLELSCVLVAVAASGYGDDQYSGRSYGGGGRPYGGSDKGYGGGYNKYEEYPERDYSFNYGVKDDYTYNYQTRDEVKKGNTVYGSYSVVEPDGNLRVVKYEADDYGFRAVVDREGYGAPVSYGHSTPYASAPPTYKATPSYKPTPAYKPAYKAPPPPPAYDDYSLPPVYKPPYKSPPPPAYKGYGGPTSSSYSTVSQYTPKRPVYSKPTPAAYRRPAYDAEY